MSSLATSSPVSASTLAYLMRWPVFRFSWLNEIFSESDVAGYSATGQVTSERRRKPFQFARGAIGRKTPTKGPDLRRSGTIVPTPGRSRAAFIFIWRSKFNFRGLDFCSCYVLIEDWPIDPRTGAC